MLQQEKKGKKKLKILQKSAEQIGLCVFFIFVQTKKEKKFIRKEKIPVGCSMLIVIVFSKIITITTISKIGWSTIRSRILLQIEKMSFLKAEVENTYNDEIEILVSNGEIIMLFETTVSELSSISMLTTLDSFAEFCLCFVERFRKWRSNGKDRGQNSRSGNVSKLIIWVQVLSTFFPHLFRSIFFVPKTQNVWLAED